MIKGFAIEISSNVAKCAVLTGNEWMHQFEVNIEGSGDKFLETIKEQAVKESETVNFKICDVNFISIAVAGLYDLTTQKLGMSSILNVKDFPIVKRAQEVFEQENVYVINDAKADTLAEWTNGSKRKDVTSLAVYKVGAGVGGGAIFDNELVVGDTKNGLPGEPGHGGGFQHDKQCSCGLVGCIEPVANVPAMEENLNIKADNSTGKLHKLKQELGRNLTLKDIEALFRTGDPDTKEAIRKPLMYLSKEISILIHFFDLSSVVISGDASELGMGLIDIIKEELRQFTLPDFYKKLDLQLATLKSWASVQGAYDYGLACYVSQHMGFNLGGK